MPKEQKRTGVIIKSVQKNLKILKYILDCQSEVSLADIGKDLGYNVSTVHHSLRTLMEEGFISQNKVTKKYDIGPEIFLSWLRGRNPEKYFSRVTPILDECVKNIGETTNLFIRNGNNAVCITGCESNHILRAFLMVGRKIPLTCTASGKAFLAYLKYEEVRDIANKEGLKKYLPNTITDLEKLFDDLKISQERGYTLEIDEYEEMITAVGVPVFDENGKVICTISTIAPSVRVNEEKILLIANELKLASRKISEIIEGMFY